MPMILIDSSATLCQEPSRVLDVAPPSTGRTHQLVESDTVAVGQGTSMAFIGKHTLTRKITVDRVEYRDGPASYLILRERTGIAVNFSGPKYLHRDPATKEPYTLDSFIRNAPPATLSLLLRERLGEQMAPEQQVALFMKTTQFKVRRHRV
ncbi:hypothetical protein DFH07DRAFT_779472 [Mycena maculata]|uniref:Uncharacterized protein n=1 Tax=Mycena maculata TaxID=230809 RepID=A0AAD7I9T7_9AGAR|nr:hypothetical protein DFH07DRAFT_779472 [Mycena maculata]